MKLSIPISVGDYLDRLSILRIKSENALQVTDELNMYEELLSQLPELSGYYYVCLFITINECLWSLEDKKRNKDLAVGSEEYIEISELITHLNDLRYQIKKSADRYFNSEIQEKKSHEI
jgi:hypothetical protein